MKINSNSNIKMLMALTRLHLNSTHTITCSAFPLHSLISYSIGINFMEKIMNFIWFRIEMQWSSLQHYRTFLLNTDQSDSALINTHEWKELQLASNPNAMRYNIKYPMVLDVHIQRLDAIVYCTIAHSTAHWIFIYLNKVLGHIL